MAPVKRYVVSILFFTHSSTVLPVCDFTARSQAKPFSGEAWPLHTYGYRHISPGFTPPGETVFTIAQDIVGIHLNIISFSTYKIFVTTFPFFIAARMIDERLENCFYDTKHHRNINQMDDAFHMFAKHSIVFPFFLAGALSFGAHDEDLK